MRIKKTVRALTLCAAATTMLVAAPVSQAKERHKGSPLPGICERVAKGSQFTADQQAAVATACEQLKADLKTARSSFDDAVSAARLSVKQARDAVHAACADGQGDTQACQDARAALRQARVQAHKDVRAARVQLKQAIAAALSAFESSVKAAVGTPPGSGDGGKGRGTGNPAEHCNDLVSHAPADKQAAVQAACDKLAADIQSAETAYNAARDGAKKQYLDASAALKSACEGQEDSQACQDARTAFSNAVTQIKADLSAAQDKRKSDVAAAQAAFRTALEGILGNP